MAIKSDRLVVSLTSDQGNYTFLYRYAKHNREGGGKEETNKHKLGSAPSARRGKSVTLWCSGPCIVDYHGRVLERNFYKATRNADS